MMTRREAREARRRRSRKIRALLAAGVVFGVGAAATLAAWNDSEYATGTFTASVFGIEGAVNAGAFSEHPSENPAALAFDISVGAMSPGTVAYTLFRVRTTGATNVGGTVLMTADGANNTALGQWLRYSVRTISGTTCDQTSFNGGTATGLPQDQSLTVGATDPGGKRTLATGGATPVNYCIRVTLPGDAPNTAQGTNLTAKWTFVATSSS